MLFLMNPGSSTLQNNSYMTTYFPSHKASKLNEKDILGTAGEVRTNSLAIFFCELLYIDLVWLGFIAYQPLSVI